MADVTRRRVKLKYVMILGVVLLPIVFVRLWHLGPFGVKPGDDVLCSKLTLTSGSKLCGVAHRTGELIDAYHVFLYRLDPTGELYQYRLGDEDSFWWISSLRPAKGERSIEIRAFGQYVAKYSLDRDVIVTMNSDRPEEMARKVNNAVVEKLVGSSSQ